MGLEAVGDFLRSHDSFFTTTHLNADGDALASVLAVARCLEHLGRPCRIVIPDREIDPAYRFLPGVEAVEGAGALSGGPLADAAVVVDAPSPERLGPLRDSLPPMERVANIDHHPSNTGFGGAQLVDPKASSTAELIYDLARHLGVAFEKELATLIYAGIAFDTGRFSFSNTSPKALSIAAQMVELGVAPNEVSRALFYERPVSSLRALGACLERLELHLGGRVSVMSVPHALFSGRTGEPLDTEGFVDAALKVRGAEVACLLKEEEPGRVRVSLRSKGECDVDAVAARFQGGGHAKAAGCNIQATLEEAKSKVLEALAEAMKAPSASEVPRG